ncbi:efflux RND transporter periplasmic adaptor subunit [Tractidigestivibacter sp.]|uniref:efflux RND transporter periplasmic adaptor subunit n=1 Tax=Tractidigestivibacter sp. TaxID=2847320 RepID=UPI002A90D810|nr:efflux RND transporter periplasmic adaptor subunit [Tractidigestivibacter sp.]MCI6273251.1 efflux RND transporter periplasmic adaptor subunit [Coriobacteriaceae bacterium]MDY5272190.1 efflux RND transporter periplasmic adaptor subunit [Tractidigestivibacter sp.]
MSQETDHTNDPGEPDKTTPVAHPLDGLPVISTDVSASPSPLSDEGTEEDEDTRKAMESLLARRKERRRKNVIIGIVAACVVVAVLVWRIASQQSAGVPEEPALQTMQVTRGEFTDEVKASGNVQPVNSVVVTPEVDGIISEVFVSEGDYVEAGATLLTVRNDSLDKAVREADIQLRSAKTQLSSAKDAYNTAYNAYYADQADLATVNSAVDAVDAAQLALETAQSAYDDAVAIANKRTVTAPSSGTIVVMNAVEGAAVGSGVGAGAAATATSGSSGTLITIGDLSQMTVSVQVNEMDISKVSVGQAARASFSALPDVELDATVTRIASVSSSDASGPYPSYGGNVVTYAVDLLIPNPNPALKPGMTASVTISSTDIPDALMLPVSAITGEGDQATVSVVTGHDESGFPTTEDRSVTVLATNGTMAAVEGSIAEGDEVVTGIMQSGMGALDGSAPSDASSTSAAM